MTAADRSICKQCWHPFTPVSALQRYCDTGCRQDAARDRHLDRPCPRCGQPLEIPSVSLHPWCRKDGGRGRKRNQWRTALTTPGGDAA